MKNSGIEWIGEIQEIWETVILSSVAKERKAKNIGLVEKNLLSLSYGKIKRKNIDTNDGLLPASFDGYNIIEDGDIVLRLTDLQNDHTSLRTGLCKEKGIITSAYTTITPNKQYIVPLFLHYYLHSFDNCKGFYGMGAGVRQGLNWDEVRKLKVLLPTIKEQSNIVTFLNKKTDEIDALIEVEKRQIEKLKEYKQAVITEAVTKGLDPTAPMKDSGVEWIGEMPAHWSRIKAINLFEEIGSGTTPKGDHYYSGGVYNWIQSGDINGGDMFECSARVNSFALSECSALKIYHAPYLIMAMYGGSVGHLSISHIDACCNQACCVMRNPNCNFDYAFFSLIAAKNFLLKSAIGGGQPNISQTIIKQLWFCKPSLEEQCRIVNYLKEKCTEVESLIGIKKKKIERLNEYKKSLIYEYVTGKKEVV